MAKSVCIIGAGPAGIIAAKTLLHDYPKDTFKVTVFEQCDRIGGLWPLSPTDDGMVNPNMCTNLSQHTVSFSDMAWPEASPTFPKAWQVGQYLKRYTERYRGIDIKTSSKVLKAFRYPDASSSERWKIEVQRNKPDASVAPKPNGFSAEADLSGEGPSKTSSEKVERPIETYFFDYLIVASGFFGMPKFPYESSRFSGPVQHSTQFRSLQDLLKLNKGDADTKGSKIVVVGGSMSGAEIAASIAMQLSSDIHSPGAAHIKDATKYTVHHIVRRPFWVMPLFLPVKPLLNTQAGQPKIFHPAPTFLPLDLVMYNLKRRPPGPIKNNSGHIKREGAAIINESVRCSIGTDQSELTHGERDYMNDSLTMRGEILTEAPWLAISDSYAEFVRSGSIKVSTGRLVRFNPKLPNQDLSVVLSSDDQEHIIEDIAAAVLATGFEATDSLSFLPEEVLKTLDYDAHCAPLPLTLDLNSTVHHDIPDLGFVGFYRGPFWGVMEMQARLLGKLWTGDEKATTALASHDSEVPKLRKVYYETPKELAQFPMGDYTYIMESFKDILGIAVGGEGRNGPVLPARYTSRSQSEMMSEQSKEALKIVNQALDDSEHHRKFVARAIFRSLQGDWKLNRSLISSISTYPSGTFHGTAKLSPRYPNPEYDAEYLYLEEGDFETDTGMRFRANRRYAHRYKEATDTLSVWFIKSDNKTVDYLFHELEILPPEGNSGWRARAHHLCIDDTYDVRYEFRFKGSNVEEWTLAYSVKGPSKDYRIESSYRR